MKMYVLFTSMIIVFMVLFSCGKEDCIQENSYQKIEIHIAPSDWAMNQFNDTDGYYISASKNIQNSGANHLSISGIMVSLAKAEKGQAIFTREVLSGHSGGWSNWGDDNGDFSIDAFNWSFNPQTHEFTIVTTDSNREPTKPDSVTIFNAVLLYDAK